MKANLLLDFCNWTRTTLITIKTFIFNTIGSNQYSNLWGWTWPWAWPWKCPCILSCLWLNTVCQWLNPSFCALIFDVSVQRISHISKKKQPMHIKKHIFECAYLYDMEQRTTKRWMAIFCLGLHRKKSEGITGKVIFQSSILPNKSLTKPA